MSFIIADGIILFQQNLWYRAYFGQAVGLSLVFAIYMTSISSCVETAQNSNFLLFFRKWSLFKYMRVWKIKLISFAANCN